MEAKLAQLDCHDFKICCAFNSDAFKYNFIVDMLRQVIFQRVHHIVVSLGTFCYGNCKTLKKNSLRLLQDLLQTDTTFKQTFISRNLVAIYSPEKQFLLIHRPFLNSKLLDQEIRSIVALGRIFDNPIKEQIFLSKNWEALQILQQFFNSSDTKVINQLVNLPKISRSRLKTVRS